MQSISEKVFQVKSIVPLNVQILGASKKQSSKKILEAFNAGIRLFGENYVQELLEKKPLLPKEIEWHFIGHLQKNKVKKIISDVKLIHSLDSFSLAEEINKRAEQVSIKTNVLIEVNIGKEKTKHGVMPEELSSFIKSLSEFKNFEIQGLMCLPPFLKVEETVSFFAETKNLFDELKKIKQENLNIKTLSMGTSNDFKQAINQGSNLVRLGTSLFGERK